MGQCLKICEGTLPDNGRLHRHFGRTFLNFDAKSILSTWKDVHRLSASTVTGSVVPCL